MAFIRSVVHGSTHQGNRALFPNGNNAQCVANATCGLIWSVLSNNQFSTEIVDRLLSSGNDIYLQTAGIRGIEVFLEPEQIPRELEVNSERVQITLNQIYYNHFPILSNGINDSVAALSLALHRHIVNLSVSNCGFLFTGQEYTVSFWQYENLYYLFNSHAVNEFGVLDKESDDRNRARLFECSSLEELARLLLIHAAVDGIMRWYNIHSVVVERLNNPNHQSVQHVPTVFSQDHFVDLTSNVSRRVLDFSPKTTNCNDAVCSPSIRSQKGRPTKQKKGRPKVAPKSSQDQHRDAVRRYTDSHPEVHRDAVRRYTDTHPDVNRDAVRRYTDSHPDVHRDAVRRYTDSHPDVHRDAVRRYTDAHPEVNRDAVRRYANSQLCKTAMHLPVSLRRSKIPIGAFSGAQFNNIKLYELKNPSLLAPNCYKCPHCKAPLFEEEKTRKMWCCGKGSYNVSDLGVIDQEFYDHPHFLRRPKSYNEIFALCATIIPSGIQPMPYGLYFTKILGRIYHRVFDMSYKGAHPNYSYMYIDDGEERALLAEGKNLNSLVVNAISEYLSAVNPHVAQFKRLSDEPSDVAHLVFEETTRRTHGPVLGGRPETLEVAAVICTDIATFNPRKLTIWKKGEAQTRKISAFHPLLEPFQYPLLYPHGTPGWHIKRTDNLGRKLTQLSYTRCLLLSEPRFSIYGRLSETWLVDLYARIEEERLGYIARCQRQPQDSGLRTGTFIEIRTVLDKSNQPQHSAVPVVGQVLNDVNTDETVHGEGGIIPGRVYLPYSFTGGERYMKVRYLDAMALVGRLGGPTYFLTFTANGKWKEITQSKHENSIGGEPQKICRVFEIKYRELLRDIRSGAFFGKVSYIVWAIEFQMRGLPHVHICFRVEGGGPKQSVEIDQFIRADLPCETEAGGRLRNLVLKHMVHGPCGPPNRTNLVCWDSKLNKCTKHFPKLHTLVTYTDDRGFVHYKRDSANMTHIQYRRKPVQIDDTWIVPYNAALLLKYDCHINLEIASTRRVVKYLFKYITKGNQLRRVSVVPEERVIDEVQDYVTKRYIGATDAAWRVLEFQLTGRNPTVDVLPVHLEGRQIVVFRPGAEAAAIAQSSSKLLLYFSRPPIPELRNLTYVEFYEQYILHTVRPRTKSVPIIAHADGKHFFTKRQQGELVARLFWVAPNRGEQYYLRVLLSKFSCQGYNDLIARGGDGCSTFQEAARALGLINDDGEYRDALIEASVFMTGNRLRHFFVLMCNIGAPAAILWNLFKDLLCEDLLEKFTADPEKAYKLGLIHIQRCLQRHGSSLIQHGLPDIQDDSTELGRERLLYSTEPQLRFVEEWERKLSIGQRTVFEYVDNLIQNKDLAVSRSIFLDGPGGYGKTLLLQIITARVRSQNGVVLCVATSGIASLNLAGGCTAHSMFHLPLDVSDGTGNWNITNATQRAELIREASVIIYDEITMAHRFLIELLDRSLKDLMQNPRPFGGKIIIFSGDFRQTSPISNTATTPADVVAISLKSSYVWQTLKQFRLTTPQRTRGNELYSSFLLDVGNGSIEQQHIVGTARNPEALIAIPHLQAVDELCELISFVFPPDILQMADQCAKRAILCTHNINVQDINNSILDSLDGELFHLYSSDFVEEQDAENLIDNDVLHQAKSKGVPDHMLRLKVGSICIITRNLNFADRLVNGTKVIIVGISYRLITVRRPGSNESFGIPRIMFKFPIVHGSPIVMFRRQFPLQLCYAMTIHKSQGQTIDVVGVDLRSDCFTHGQLYVALSRVRSPEHIRLLVLPNRLHDGIAMVKNIVYRELL